MKRYAKCLSLLLTAVMLFSCFGLCASADVNTCVHEYQTTVVQPTCSEQGYTLYACGKCGDYYKNDFVDALGHIYDADHPVVNTPATCEAEGTQEWECVRCKSHKTVTLPILSHADNDKDGYCDSCHYYMGKKTVFSPYDWFVAFFAFLKEWFRGIFA